MGHRGGECKVRTRGLWTGDRGSTQKSDGSGEVGEGGECGYWFRHSL